MFKEIGFIALSITLSLIISAMFTGGIAVALYAISLGDYLLALKGFVVCVIMVIGCTLLSVRTEKEGQNE